MVTNSQILIICIGILLINLAATIFLVRRLGKKVQSDITAMVQEVDGILVEAQAVASKAYSQMGTVGATAKQEKALEKMVANDMMRAELGMDSAEIQQILSVISPSTAEYVKKNPQIAMKLLPKLLQYVETNKGKTEGSRSSGPSKAWT